MRLLSAASVVALLVSVAGAPPAVAATSVPTAPYLALTLDDGTHELQAARPREPVSASWPDSAGPTVQLTGTDVSGMDFSVTLTPPSVPLAPGRYRTSREQTVTSPALSTSLCNDGEGTLDVTDVVQDDARRIIRLSASYELACSYDPFTPARGELRLETATGFRAARTAPSAIDLGPVRRDLGRPATVTVTSTGSDAVTFGPARSAGAGASDVSVVRDGCALRSVPAGGACTVEVAVRPSSRGEQSALVEVPDDTRAGVHRTQLAYEGVDLPSAAVDGRPYSSSRRAGACWSEPVDSGDRPVTHYRIWAAVDDGPLEERASATHPCALDAGLPRGRTMRYAVAPVTEIGEGPRSDVVAATAPLLEVVWSAFGSIRTSAFDGSEERYLTQGFFPRLSPAGDRLAFVRDQRLWVADLESSPRALSSTQEPGIANERRVTADELAEDEPSWTPDGRSLVYSRPGHTAEPALARVDVATGAAAALEQGERAHMPAVAPSGEHVVARSLADAGAPLVALSLRTGQRTPLAGTEAAFDPAWTPDGQGVVFSRLVEQETPPGEVTRERAQLVVVPPTGGSPRVLVDLEGASREPAVTDDGRTVWFSHQAYGGMAQLWSAPFDDSGEPKQLPGETYQPEWEPSVLGPGTERARDTSAPAPPTVTAETVRADSATLQLARPDDADVLETFARLSRPGEPAPATRDDGAGVPVGDGVVELAGLRASSSYEVALFAVDSSGNTARRVHRLTTAADGSPEPQWSPGTARPTDDACPPGRVPPTAFTDLEDSPHRPAVDCAVWWGLASGRSPSSYGPELDVTRAQMATLVAKLVERSGGSLPPGRDAFRDDDGSVHEASIDRLAAAGIVSGRADGTFAPHDPVPRGAMTTFLVRAYEYRMKTTLADGQDWFDDDDGSTHEAMTNRAATVGFTGGIGPREFGPSRLVRRDQLAAFLVRVLDLVVEQGAAAPPDA